MYSRESIRNTVDLLKSYSQQIEYYPGENCNMTLNGQFLSFPYSEIIEALVTSECLEDYENGIVTHLDGVRQHRSDFIAQLDADYLRPAVLEIFEKALHNFDRVRTANSMTEAAYESLNTIEKMIYNSRLQTTILK